MVDGIPSLEVLPSDPSKIHLSCWHERQMLAHTERIFKALDGLKNLPGTHLHILSEEKWDSEGIKVS